MKLEIKTLRELREKKINIDCPKLKNLPETTLDVKFAGGIS